MNEAAFSNKLILTFIKFPYQLPLITATLAYTDFYSLSNIVRNCSIFGNQEPLLSSYSLDSSQDTHRTTRIEYNQLPIPEVYHGHIS